MELVRSKLHKKKFLFTIILFLSYILILLMPFETYGSIGLVHTKFLKMLFILNFSIILIWFNWKNKLIIDPIALMLISFLLLTSIILLISPDLGTLTKWGQFINITIFYFLMSQNLTLNNILKRKFPFYISLITLIIFLIIFLQIYFDLLWPSDVVNSVTGKERPVAFFNNTNAMSGFLVLNVLFLFWYLILNKFKLFLFLGCIAGLLGIFWGESLGAIISLVIGILILIVYKYNKLKLFLFISFISLSLLGVLILFSTNFRELIIFILDKEGRFQLWYTTTLIIKDNWLTGIGNYNFNNMLGNYGYVSLYGAIHPHPHNVFLDLAVTYGIIGFVFSIILLLILLKYLKIILTTKNVNLVLITVLIFSSLVRDLVDGGFLIGTSSVSIYLYFIIAVYNRNV